MSDGTHAQTEAHAGRSIAPARIFVLPNDKVRQRQRHWHLEHRPLLPQLLCSAALLCCHLVQQLA